MDSLFVAIGLVALLGGGELLVRGGAALALRAGLSTVVVGAVVLGFGTSMPELLTSLSAAYAGAPGIAVGNVLGSNIANILLILGLAAVIAPVAAQAADREDRVWLALVTLAALALMVFFTTLGRAVGAALLLALVLYIWRALKRGSGADDLPAALPVQAWAIAGLLIGGIAALAAGAWLLVEGATGIARALGISETVIGLTLVAVGTSLPELATSVIAARRGQAGLALGNVLGSNVFNMLAILGLTAALIPIPVPVMLSRVDLAVFGGSALLLLVLLARGGVGRGAGLACLALYGGYIGWLALNPG